MRLVNVAETRESAAEQWIADGSAGPAPSTAATVEVDLEALQEAYSPRDDPCDEHHARVLAESSEQLPPICIHRQTMRVIDGSHRVMAARIRGRKTIRARYFDGSEEEAYLEAVRANVNHGKPLSLAERERAAARILQTSPNWSDRAVASMCGLSPKTVGAIRRRAGEEIPHSDTRIGLDGRYRRASTDEGRGQAAELLRADLTVSLREIARRTGLSVGTVRDVRDKVQRGASPFARSWALRPAAPSTDQPDPAALLDGLLADAALTSAAGGRAILRWLMEHFVSPEQWEPLVAAIPVSRVYAIADFARSCASSWLAFAQALERQPRAAVQ
jgi:ParB-like chromosome segregation protein Spo0J